jgi:hypothetical protein
LQNLYPHWVERKFPGRRTEIFIDYEIKKQGFSVPQSHLRAMIFETGPGEYHLSHVDQKLSLPPTMNFAIRVQGHQALAKVRQTEQKNPALWRLQKEWHRQHSQWIPAWKVQMQGSPHTYFVDVRNGAISAQLSELALTTDSEPLPKALPFKPQPNVTPDSQAVYFYGRGTPPLGKDGTLAFLALPLLQVTDASQQILWTDQQGMLRTSAKPEGLRPRLHSPSFEVTDTKNRDVEFRLSGNGHQYQGILNPNGHSHQTAQVNTFVALAEVEDFLYRRNAFERDPQKRVLRAFVNLNLESCNAKYRNGLVAFYEETDECRNTAFDTVVYHEYAHFIDDLHGGITDLALSEGMGDVLATFLTQQPLIGQEINKLDLSPQRSADNLAVYRPAENGPMNYTTLYERAQAWSGFAWHSRQALIAKYGGEEGRLLAELFFLTPLETNAPDIPSAVAEVLARAAQGDPQRYADDLALLQKAARRHGLSSGEKNLWAN